MSNPSDNRAYFDSVQDYFLERTGRGLMLSSRDLELLIGWRNSGASVSAVCQGIDAAVESLNQPPRDLHAVRKFIESGLLTSSAIPGPPPIQRVAAEPEDPWHIAIDRLEDARQQASRPELASSYQQASRRVHDAREASADPWRELYDLDDWLVSDVFERLGEDERRLIDLEIEGRHGAHLAMMSDEARAETMLQSRRTALEKRLGLISLVG